MVKFYHILTKEPYYPVSESNFEKWVKRQRRKQLIIATVSPIIGFIVSFAIFYFIFHYNK